MIDKERREEARHYGLKAETSHLNVSSALFRQHAKDFYQYHRSFKGPDFSPVPYFLLCRAIELQFKAVHLEQFKSAHPGHQTQADVKKFGHDLIKSYNALPAVAQDAHFPTVVVAQTDQRDL